MQIFCGLVEFELADCEFYVHFDAQSAQPHEIVNDLAGVSRRGGIVEQSRLQHHFFRIKADPLVRTGIIIMTANRILVFPGKTKLEIVAGNSFMDTNRAWIHRSRAPEVAKLV